MQNGYEIRKIYRRHRDPPKVVVTLMARMTLRLLGLKKKVVIVLHAQKQLTCVQPIWSNTFKTKISFAKQSLNDEAKIRAS